MYRHEYITQKREAKGIAKVEMAEFLEMDTGNYCRLEQGKYKNIPSCKIKKLCEVLELDLYYLLNVKSETIVKGEME